MSVRFAIAVLVFMMVQGVMFGAGIVAVLATPLASDAASLIPAVVFLATILALPLSWFIAPRLRARYWRPSRPD